MSLGFTKIKWANIIETMGLYRNHVNFILFLLEETYQTMNMNVNTCRLNSNWEMCYQLSEEAISDLVDIVSFMTTDPTGRIASAALYPMNIGYITFFRTQIKSFVAFRQMAADYLTVPTLTEDQYYDLDEDGNRIEPPKTFTESGVFTYNLELESDT